MIEPPLVFLVGELVRDGSLLLAMPLAILAGLISFLSPCVLPLVPGYLAYTTGLSASDLASGEAASQPRQTRRILLGTLGFVFGVGLVFVTLGALLGGFSAALREHIDTLSRLFGVVTIVLGLLLAGVLSRVELLNRDLRIHRLPRAGLIGAPLIGIAFALGWTPCIGPTLGMVLGLAASSEQASALRGAVLAFAYCLGLGIPLLVAGLAFGRAMRAFAVIKRHYQAVMVFSGGLLVVIGVLQVTGVWMLLMDELQRQFGSMSLPL
jgi:cytochrome c-type biogenesis protein